MNTEIACAVKYIHSCALSPTVTKHDAEVIFDIVNRYFGEFERSQSFRGAEIAILPRFRELLKFFNREQGVLFASKFFLFCYTLTQDYKKIQTPIYKHVAVPYKDWIIRHWQILSPAVANIAQGEEYVFICRHAVTQGMYAPGSSIYTFANALLEAKRKVTIVCLGNVSKQFGELSNQYPNLNIYSLKNATLTQRLSSLIEFLRIVRPKTVLTEVEFDIVSILSILAPDIPIIFLSPGFYNLPWFDKIGLTDSLIVDTESSRASDFFEIPTYVSSKVLNPKVDDQKVSQLKNFFGFDHNDFVLGSFARMEKFQKPFLSVLQQVLKRCPHAKVVLAGPNDRSPVEQALKEFIASRRAFVLPVTDVHVLGHCINLGVDTFPTHSGFSVLELMAKGIPVVAKKDSDNHINWRQRIPELMRENDDCLVELICELALDLGAHKQFFHQSKELVISSSNDRKFVYAVDNAIEETQFSKVKQIA